MMNFHIETNHLKAGMTAGAIGGVVFGAMMGSMGMLPMIAMLFGSESAILGFILHIGISVTIGAAFAIFFGHAANTEIKSISLGMTFGFIWWILGPLYIMPVWLGMGPQLGLEGVTNALPSLWGHLLFGFILGLMYAFIQRQEKSHR